MTQPTPEPTEQKDKRNPKDTVKSTAASSLLAQAQAAKTPTELQTVLVNLIKQLGL